jgi:hypothetical protein
LSLWPNALRAALTNAGYTPHGTGVIPIMSGQSPYIDGTAWTMSGTAFTTTSLLGPQQATGTVLSSLVKMPPGAIATMSAQTGNTLTVYCATYTDSSSGLTIAIDGTNVGTACATTSAAATPLAQNFSVAAGSHTAKLTSNSTGNAYLYGAEWTANPYGVAIDNYSIAGAQATAFAGHFDFADLQSGDALTIIALGTNEAIQATSTAAYAANMNAIAGHEMARGSSIFILTEPPCGTGACVTNLPAMVTAALGVAQSSGYAYASSSTQFPSFAIANEWALYSDNSTHPNDSGQLLIASLVTQNVLPGNTVGGQTFNGPITIYNAPGQGGYSPQISLYNNSGKSGYDTNIQFANPTYEWGLGFHQSNGHFYILDWTTANYAMDIDQSSVATLTANANYGNLYLKNTNTGAAAETAIVYTGTGRSFMAGVGNSSDTTYGMANKWGVYDLTANNGIPRLSIDSTGITTVNQGLRLPARTFASWTTCAAAYDGAMIRVSDSTTTTVGSVVTGGGANKVTAVCDGANYRVRAGF